MGRENSALLESGHEVLARGEQLLQMLQVPPEAVDMEGVGALLQLREAALLQMSALLRGGPLSPELGDELKPLIEQQQALEAALTRHMSAIDVESRRNQAVRANVDGFRRLMKPDATSRRLNQVR